jgi:hypothetical protein
LKTLAVDPALLKQLGKPSASGETVSIKKLMASVDKKLDLVAKVTDEHGVT